MKKLLPTLLLIAGTAVITFLLMQFLVPGQIKETFSRWSSMRMYDMTISDCLALILIVLFIVSPFKTDTK